MNSNTEKKLEYVEEMFRKYGAVPAETDPSELEKMKDLGLRLSYVRDGLYYRVELDSFAEGEVITITAAENPAYARLGLGDNIAGFRVGLPEEKIEREVRFAFGLEPYPETYPDYS